MALYLNLYHEVQNQKLKRQRDPFKIAIMAALIVAMGFIVYYFWRAESVKTVVADANRTQDNWAKKLEPQSKEAETQHEQYDQNIKLAASVLHKMENRFYWAPLIEQIIQTVPPEIQITSLDGAQTTEGQKKVTLSISGIATGAQPRATAEKLRIAFQEKLSTPYKQVTSIFRSLEDGTENVAYEGKSTPTVLFVIDITFVSPDINDNGKSTPAPKP